MERFATIYVMKEANSSLVMELERKFETLLDSARIMRFFNPQDEPIRLSER